MRHTLFKRKLTDDKDTTLHSVQPDPKHKQGELYSLQVKTGQNRKSNYYVLEKGTIHQENIIIIKAYAKMVCSHFMTANPPDIEDQININAIKAVDFVIHC